MPRALEVGNGGTMGSKSDKSNPNVIPPEAGIQNGRSTESLLVRASAGITMVQPLIFRTGATYFGVRFTHEDEDEGEKLVETFSTCMQCQAENGIPNFSSFAMVQIPDDGVIEATCHLGHRTIIVIQQTKFELLSEMAIKAIADGYFRDAVASFAGSLERLHEFFVRATLHKNAVPNSEVSLSWKAMANQSERQLGAFIASYAQETKQSPRLLPQTQTEFRNKVIHKGKFPSRAEVVEFGESFLECAVPVMRLLSSPNYVESVQALIAERHRECSALAKKAKLLSGTQSIPTFLSLNREGEQLEIEHAINVRDAMPDFRKIEEAKHLLNDLIRNADAKKKSGERGV